jgi:t-SNARE complex subunit (syntaxin)
MQSLKNQNEALQALLIQEREKSLKLKERLVLGFSQMIEQVSTEHQESLNKIDQLATSHLEQSIQHLESSVNSANDSSSQFKNESLSNLNELVTVSNTVRETLASKSKVFIQSIFL